MLSSCYSDLFFYDLNGLMLFLLLATHVEISSVIKVCTLCCQTNDVNLDDKTIALYENFNASEVMGIKKKDGVSKGKGRPKSCLERKYKRRKDTQKYSSVRHNFSPTMPIPIIQVEQGRTYTATTRQNVLFSHGCQDTLAIGINATQVGSITSINFYIVSLAD